MRRTYTRRGSQKKEKKRKGKESDLPFEMLPDAILSDVFRQISNPQVTCLSNHFAPNSSFGIGCCGIVWRHCTTTHNLDQGRIIHQTLHQHTEKKRAIFSIDRNRPASTPLSFPRHTHSLSLSLLRNWKSASSALLSSLYLRQRRDQFVHASLSLPRHCQFDFTSGKRDALITSH